MSTRRLQDPTSIDFGRHSEDYAAYRPGPPASFYERLDAVAPLSGSRSLDLGTGPRTVALELAVRGGSVVGIHVSAEQIAAAQRVARERKLENRARFQIASAESTGLQASSFDLVTACQCWHWFDASAVMEEVRRVLRPGGALAIVDYSYLPEDPALKDAWHLVPEPGE